MTEEDRIRQTFEDYVKAFRAGDAEACGQFYAEDVEYIACGMAPSLAALIYPNYVCRQQSGFI
jgi:ketosteroid isomerase-like protein